MEYIDDIVFAEGLSPGQMEELDKIKRPQLKADIGASMTREHERYFPDKLYFPPREMD